MHQGSHSEWRPFAYVCVADRGCRAAIVEALQRQGWAVIEHATGFDVIHALSGVIDGDTPWRKPGMIVIDALARGCAGTTIAHGLRDLGMSIPVVLVIRECSPCTDDTTVTVDPRIAPHVVGELARPWSPARFFVDPQLEARAVA